MGYYEYGGSYIASWGLNYDGYDHKGYMTN